MSQSFYSQFSKTCNRQNSGLLLQVTSIKGFSHFVATSAPLPVASLTKLTVPVIDEYGCKTMRFGGKVVNQVDELQVVMSSPVAI